GIDRQLRHLWLHPVERRGDLADLSIYGRTRLVSDDAILTPYRLIRWGVILNSPDPYQSDPCVSAFIGGTNESTPRTPSGTDPHDNKDELYRDSSFFSASRSQSKHRSRPSFNTTPFKKPARQNTVFPQSIQTPTFSFNSSPPLPLFFGLCSA